MKGIINKGIQEMVESKCGPVVWNRIKEVAGCDEPFFAITQSYPDDMTTALITAAANELGVETEDLMVEYGKFVLPNTVKQNYPTYFALAGRNAREFLLNMDRVHDKVTQSIMDAMPPHFEYEELDNGRLLIHYASTRNLCAVLRGLILGVGVLFNEPLQVREVACMLKGEARCTIEVTFS